MDPVEGLFHDLDAALAGRGLARFELKIVGSTALFAQTTWRRGTKDSDAVHTWDFDLPLKALLLQLSGEGTVLARRRGIHLEFVGQGILLLAEAPDWKPWLSLEHFDVVVLDPTDVVVAKLARLHGDDILDIEAMVERGLVRHDRLLERFRSAVVHHGFHGMGHKLPKAIDNLNRIERDVFVVAETEIEVPEWMDQ